MNLYRIVSRSAALLLAAGICLPALAEQMRPIGDYEAHYSLVPTLFLKADIAAGYDITRSRDRALLTVSILDADGGPVTADVRGRVKDLLGVQQALDFEEVREGPAVYYLATIRHSDRDVLRFDIRITTPDGADHELAFQQKMYWENR
ncbi:MAG: DUF4426 domain-containing protein [Gammaproteobacteria bacterium]|nr:DUF4426 domain-containing protein [Gammaproteobacteria bacterium]